MTTEDQLVQFSVFAEMSRDHLGELAGQAQIQKVDAGETVFQEGAAAANLYGVLSGKIELSLRATEDVLKTDIQYEEYDRSKKEIVERNIVVDTIAPQEIFGWSALVSDGRYTSRATARQRSTIIVFSASSLCSYFSAHPEAGYPFMKGTIEVISKRFAVRTDRLVEGWSEAFGLDRI